MLSSSLDTLFKVSKTTSPQKIFTYDCVTLYIPNYKYQRTQIFSFDVSLHYRVVNKNSVTKLMVFS